MNTTKKKKLFKVPHTYVILVGLTILIAILSYIIPASTYDTVQIGDRTVVDPNTYHYVEQTPVTIMQLLTSIPRGLQEAAEISFFIFILGGSFAIITKTGALEVGVGNLAKKLENYPTLIVPVIIVLFSILGGTVGLSEECIIFIPIGILLSRSLGYDAMVGTAIIFLGAAVGFNSGFMNPFTVGVAQSIAELPLFSAMWYRLIIWAVFNVATIYMVLKYAKKVRKDPTKSYCYELEQSEAEEIQSVENIGNFTKTHVIVICLFLMAIGIVVYGVIKLGFYINEIVGVFLGLGIISGFIAKMTPSEIAVTFIDGAKDMAMGALVVGVARSILVVLNDGQILYTIVHAVSQLIQLVPRSISAVFMFLFQLVLNFFIPSGSGQAATTMPIMTPLSDLVGISRQTAVLAFHLGDGISNSIIPTGGSLLASLSVAKIDFEKWVKFVWPIILVWIIIACVFVAIAASIHLA